MARIYTSVLIKIGSKLSLGFLLGFSFCYFTNIHYVVEVKTIEGKIDPARFFVTTFTRFHEISNYSMNNENACGGDAVYMLSIIITAPHHFSRRKYIRETWVNELKGYNNSNIPHAHKLKYMFLIGKSKIENITASTMLEEEYRTHNDIIQDNFIDTYYNLTLKSLSMLNWARTYCNQSQFLLKIDDDVDLNIKTLMNVIQFKQKHTNYIRFLLGYKMGHYKPITNTKSKWYNPINTTFHDHFLSGTSYLLTGNLMESMWFKSKNVSLIHLEDVYITGKLAAEVGAHLIHSTSFCAFLNRKRRKSRRRNCATAHYM